MTNVPIRKTIQHRLGNAAQIAELWAARDGRYTVAERKAFGAIRDHLKAALDQLGEPNEGAIQRMDTILDAHQPIMQGMEMPGDYHRYLRDNVALILQSQLTGSQP